MPRLLTFWAGAHLLVLGGCYSDYLRQSAVQTIASNIQPANASLVRRLETSRNPTGQGVLVFVRSRSDCGPMYSWLWLSNQRSYALDSPSRAATQRLRLLAQAPQSDTRRIGEAGEDGTSAVRSSVCESNR